MACIWAVSFIEKCFVIVEEGSRKPSYSARSSVIHVDIKQGDVKLVGSPPNLLADVANISKKQDDEPLSPTYQRIEDVKSFNCETINPVNSDPSLVVPHVPLGGSPKLPKRNETVIILATCDAS